MAKYVITKELDEKYYAYKVEGKEKYSFMFGTSSFSLEDCEKKLRIVTSKKNIVKELEI